MEGLLSTGPTPSSLERTTRQLDQLIRGPRGSLLPSCIKKQNISIANGATTSLLEHGYINIYYYLITFLKMGEKGIL